MKNAHKTIGLLLMIMLATTALFPRKVSAAVSSKDLRALSMASAQIIASQIVTPEMNDYSKAQAIHDWIINNTQYDYMNYMAGTVPSASYNKEGVFLNHIAVCSGYADAFSYLSKLVGLKCEIVDGIASSDGIAGSHAWNRVMIDGNWLYIDCTWDDPVCLDGSSTLTYNYFLIPYEAMAADHIQQTAYRRY